MLPLAPASAQGTSSVDPALLQQLSPDDRQRALQALQGNRGESSDSPTATVPATRPRLATPAKVVGARVVDVAGERNLPFFGYELFNADSNVFAPQSNVPAPAEYVLGPGDVVRVQLFGNQNETLNLSVTRDGLINFPKLGPVQVAGLRFDDARQVIERRVEKELIGVQTNITMGPLRGIQVFLLGDALHPGSYSVSGLSTITHALFAGGGVTPGGSLRDIQLKRDGRLVRHLDLYDFLLRGDSAADVRLQAGDVVFVPPVGARLAIAGSVKRPAIYELKGPIRLQAALELAGGLAANARRGQVLLERFNSNGQRTLLELDLAARGAMDTEVRDGDRLNIQTVSGQIDNRVSVLGHVRYPNTYAWIADLTLSRLLALAQVRPSDTESELYPLMALLEHTNPRTGLREWQGFDLLAAQRGEQDFSLQPDDRVLVLNRSNIEYLRSPEVSAALRGEVTLLPPVDELVATNTETDVAGELVPRLRDEVHAESDYGPEADSEQSRPFARDAHDAKLARKKNAGATMQCPGLAEVVKISDSSRALSIRMAISSEEASSEVRSRQSQQAYAARQSRASCPEVFREAPGALVYLLERGVAVVGEVRRPGLYPVADGTSLQRLLEMAGGPTNEADARQLDVFAVKAAVAGGSPRFTSVQTAALMDRPVAPGEIYQFKPGTALQEVGSVNLRGEVRFPGRYIISRGERLSDLLARAGGLNEGAYAYGAVFTRDSTRKAEAESNRRAANDLRDALATATTKGLNQGQNQASATFLTELVQKLETAPPVGRIVIEADPSVLAARPSGNLLLEGGDDLYIPKRPSAVTVTGQVLNPGSLSFVADGKAEDYLQQSGGLAKSADDNRIFLVLPNGSARPLQTSFWNYRSEPIPPGSVIVVPRDAAPMTGLLLTERIASIVSSLALSAAALVTINR